MWNEQKYLENFRLISGQRYLSQKLGSDIFTYKRILFAIEGKIFMWLLKVAYFDKEGLVALEGIGAKVILI